MKANSDKSKQSKKATRRVLAGVLCGASVLSLVLSLVMPPISQAIANDAQAVPTEEAVADENTLDEEAGAGNSTGKDAENRISDDAEGGASEGAVTEGQPSDDTKAEGDTQSADDGANGDGAIALTAGNESPYTITINSGDELSKKLLNENLRDAKGCATFELVNDIECNQEIGFEQTVDNPINITLNLNGHKIKYTNQSQPLFNITGGATLTIKDLIKDSDSEKDPEKASEKVIKVQELNDQGQNLNPTNYGKEAVLSYDNGIPSNLTYYVTQSSPSATDTTKTTETLYEHSVDIKGAIVACGGNGNLKLININGGHFSLENGVLTQKKDCHVQNLVYAENESTVNMNGGYVCGGYCRWNGAGAGISVKKSTLSISNGVIAGNCAPSGGGVYADGSIVTVAGGVISGNSTNSNGFGGGIMAEHDGSVTVSGGYITNNRYANFCGKDGYGCHGGAGLAAINGAHVTISDGQITGNYSGEAGGGVYVSDQWGNGSMAWLNITGGIIASNVSYRSEGAGIRVGQKVDAMIGDTPDNNGTPGSKVYITNNCCMSRFDWGGGGIFVQGDSKIAENAGRLFVYNSYISSNTAGGYGGGVAVCPTGKTLVTNTKGTAIFGNSSANSEQKANGYKSAENTGNDGTPHLSAGGADDTNKTEDQDAYNSDKFRENGHADFFLAARGHNAPIAVVTGKMLGGGDARYSGSIELEKAINIPANGCCWGKNSIGLTSGVMSGVMAKDEAAIQARNDAQNEATTFITGNYSWDHGGGIMSNGDLYLGEPADAYVYPSLKLKATKELAGRDLKDGEFTFTVYRKDSDTAKAPSWDNNGNFSHGGCGFVKSAKNIAGNIAFDLSEKLSEQLHDGKQLSEQLLKNGTGEITYYLVEDAGNLPGVIYDRAVYEIKVTVKYNKTVLMSVPIQGNSSATRNLNVHNYTIDGVYVTKISGGSAGSSRTASVDANGYYSIVDSSSATSTNKATFTNKYDPEVSWTPEATKVVEGGEMKEFTLQLAEDSKFNNIIGTAVTSAGKDTKQTLSFKDTTDKNKTVELKYSLSDIRNNPNDPGGSTGGPFKTFTYYVREKTDGSQFSHYTYDQSVYKFTVEPTYDTEKGEINCRVTYKKGTVDAKGTWKSAETEDHKFPDTTPTFTNTYSTSLPLSGMSGVTLTYLAGAAVLCAAAAWMHIRRKANAKGGKRRE